MAQPQRVVRQHASMLSSEAFVERLLQLDKVCRDLEAELESAKERAKDAKAAADEGASALRAWVRERTEDPPPLLKGLTE